MPIPSYKIFEQYEPDKYRTSLEKQAEKVVKEAEKEGLKAPETQETLEFQEAREILGKDFLGPEALEKTFGFKPEEIPPIPFSREELERAKELNQFLILRTDRAEDDSPLTMERMSEMLQPEFNKNDQGKILHKVDWYAKENFYKKETPKRSWSLVSKEFVPNSTSKDYLGQTEAVIKYSTAKVFKGQDLPPEYQEAIKEFNDQKDEIKTLMTDDWKKAAQKLADLKITQLIRQTPVEALCDWLVYFKNNNQRLNEKMYTWTKSRSSDGNLVDVGEFDSDGVGVIGWGPGVSGGDLGVAFSRSL